MLADKTLSRWTMALASFRHYPRLMWPIALGIAAATATIIGALLVGDSLRGSLRFLALDRIGKIDHVVLAPNFFDGQAIKNHEGDPGTIQPVILFPSTSLETKVGDQLSRASGVLTLGIDDSFWSLGEPLDAPAISDNEIFLNEALANELSVKIGDTVTLQIPAPAAVPADNPLGKRDSESVPIANLKVTAILPNSSIARFDLQSSQRASLNAFISAATVQNALSRPDQFNAVVYSEPTADRASSSPKENRSSEEQMNALKFSLQDFGFHLNRHTVVDPRDESKVIYDYYQLTSDRMIIPQVAVEAATKAIGAADSTEVLAYLANGIQSAAADNKPSVPYSIVAGIDFNQFGDDKEAWQYRANVKLDTSKGSSNVCIINQWLAEQADLKVGDEVRLDYFQSENEDGREVELSTKLTVIGIVPITQPARAFVRNRPAVFNDAPTVFNDPNMTPSVAGITDQDSISDWETPFPLTRSVSEADDMYWNNYRLTPKLFVPLSTAQSLFGSRFGDVSSIRFSPKAHSSQEELANRITKALQDVAPELGWRSIPLRANQLAASSGTTPFDGLFLALSFFVIAAALMLIFLLVRLSVEQRSTEWGIVKAAGWSPRQVRNQIFIELLPAIGLGVLIGIPLGIIFCRAILQLLTGQWVGAIGVPFLEFYWTSRSIAIGSAIGTFAALMTIWFSLRYLSQKSIVELLRNSINSLPSSQQRRRSRMGYVIACVFFMLAMALPVIAMSLQGPAQAGAYLGAGFCLLISLITMFYHLVISSSRGTDARVPRMAALSLVGFAMSSLERNRMRSLLAVSLIAVAAFLLLSVSLFHVEPDERGTGGFAMMAKSDLPIARDLNDKDIRESQLGTKAAEVLSSTQIVPMRLRSGDDAGCNNLYQASQPQVLGVNRIIQSIDLGVDSNPGSSMFAWAGYEAIEDGSNPWSLLDRAADGTASRPIPVIIDQNTAMWGLHLGAKVGEIFAYDYDGKLLHFKTVGLLQNTILQGYLIIDEKNFKSAFPDIAGSRFFLIKASSPSEQIATTLESGWANEGLDVIQSKDVLEQLLAVQNTYLSAFQSLGSLGLILGTLGLGVVQIRSVVERSGELGLMRAIGFSFQRIGRSLMTEHLFLLLSGTLIGSVAAMFAVAFALARQQAVGGIIWPLSMLGLVIIVGLIAGIFAIRRASKIPVLAALRGR